MTMFECSLIESSQTYYVLVRHISITCWRDEKLCYEFPIRKHTCSVGSGPIPTLLIHWFPHHDMCDYLCYSPSDRLNVLQPVWSPSIPAHCTDVSGSPSFGSRARIGLKYSIFWHYSCPSGLVPLINIQQKYQYRCYDSRLLVGIRV